MNYSVSDLPVKRREEWAVDAGRKMLSRHAESHRTVRAPYSNTGLPYRDWQHRVWIVVNYSVSRDVITGYEWNQLILSLADPEDCLSVMQRGTDCDRNHALSILDTQTVLESNFKCSALCRYHMFSRRCMSPRIATKQAISTVSAKKVVKSLSVCWSFIDFWWLQLLQNSEEETNLIPQSVGEMLDT